MSDPQFTREHGNSYLAIAEWVGLLGVLPFFFLIGLSAVNAARVMAYLRRTGNVFSPGVPLATVVIAGLVHAAFEDWLFAVGYYVSVFFWVTAFALVDYVPEPVPALAKSGAAVGSQSWPDRFGAAAPGR
jgi:hypothetical protein